MPGKPAADEASGIRKRRIELVDVTGNAAIGKIVLDYPDAYIVDYMSLLKTNGEWRIINKIFMTEMKKKYVGQIGGWVEYASSLFLTFLPGMEPGRRVAVLLNKELRAVVGIVLSLGLLRLYRRLTPEPEVSGRVAGIALVASVLTGIAGYSLHAAIMVGIGLQPSFASFLDPTTAPRSILEFVFAFLVWSAAYFGVLIWRRSEEREREAMEARRLAQEAQLQMLAYQLNPHFLFNALTSIRAMIDEDRARARQMVTELAAFLRHALVERAFVTTTLAAELDALRGYLAIEQIRFEERLAIETHVEAAAEACAIPAFLI